MLRIKGVKRGPFYMTRSVDCITAKMIKRSRQKGPKVVDQFFNIRFAEVEVLWEKNVESIGKIHKRSHENRHTCTKRWYTLSVIELKKVQRINWRVSNWWLDSQQVFLPHEKKARSKNTVKCSRYKSARFTLYQRMYLSTRGARYRIAGECFVVDRFLNW